MKLYQLPPALKKAILAFLFLLTSGLLFGLGFLYSTIGASSAATASHYAGDQMPADELDFAENLPKPLPEMFITTHNHLLGFAFIFAPVCLLFYFNSLITGRLKSILIAEPFFSVFITFLSIWGIRFISPKLAIITVVAGTATYLAYFLLTGTIVFELLFIRNSNES